MMQTPVAQRDIFKDMESDSEIQFLVFKDQEYVRLNGYMQPRISIGSSPEADLVLDHRSVADIHADVTVEAGRLLLTNYRPNDGLRVNGRSIEKTGLKRWDVIDIGPFSVVLKKELNGNGDAPDDGTVPAEKKAKKDEEKKESSRKTDSAVGSEEDFKKYTILLKNEYKNDADREKVARRLGRKFGKKPDRILPLLKKKGQVLKEELSLKKALKFKDILERSGAYCILTSLNPDIEDEDDDEGDIPASFSLKEKLSILNGGNQAQNFAGNEIRPQLEVIRSINERIMDVQYIPRGRRYQTRIDTGKLKLAGISNSNRGYITFPYTCEGYLFKNGRKTELSAFKVEKYLYRKRRGLFRLPISFGESVVITEGLCEYQIRHTSRTESPAVAATAIEKQITWQHWAWSTGIHLFLLLVACIAFSISMKAPEKENIHFVKIDISELEDDKKLKPEATKPPPKKEPPKIEPAKKKPEAVKPVKKQPPKRLAKASKSARNAASSEKAAAPSKHPDAGGGVGEGNVRNRNIQQTGLLSLLGDGGAAGSSNVIASVNNIDAVEVPGASDRQFSVGGVKGSLGTGKISISTGEIVQTKGSRQVLRSAGAEGPGTVAALEKGEIGQKQVKGMVTAKMTRTVSVQGGMSREMVKRVIDQHLEEIQYCYESALMENPAIMGRIVYEWKILMSGRVGEVRIASSTVNSHQIHGCIKSAIKSWQFPKPVGTEVVVSYPFVFDLVGF